MQISLENIYISYCNLDSREDRNNRMISELNRVNLPIIRQRSYPWKELWDNADSEHKHMYSYMHNIRRTPGAIGAWMSMIEIMKKALKQGKHSWIMEDDVLICDDIHDRLPIIFDFLNKNPWNIFFLGGTYHKNEIVWHQLNSNNKHIHPEIYGKCSCNLNKDWESTENPYINRVYGAFSTHAWLVNKDSIQTLIDWMYKEMHFSMGVDWWTIIHQPELNCFAFNPGCIRQYNSISNIGEGIANQEGFQTLGKHVFSRFMDKYQWN